MAHLSFTLTVLLHSPGVTLMDFVAPLSSCPSDIPLKADKIEKINGERPFSSPPGWGDAAACRYWAGGLHATWPR